MLSFKDWIKLNESNDLILNHSLSTAFSKIEEYCEDELIYDEINFLRDSDSLTIKLVQENSKEVFVYDSEDVVQVESIIVIKVIFNKEDEDLNTLYELGFIDGDELLSAVDFKYTNRLYLSEDLFDIGDLKETQKELKLDQSKFFVDGKINIPNLEYFNDQIVEVYQDGTDLLDDARSLIDSKLEEIDDEHRD